MQWNRKKLTAADYSLVKRELELRPTVNCENMPLEQFLWSRFYDTAYIRTETGLLWVMHTPEECYSIVPACRKADLRQNFALTEQYFNTELHLKLNMYLVDAEAAAALDLPKDRYEIVEQRSYFDFIYDAEKLRTLSGRAYHKKKNHVNGFLKLYGDRSEFRILTASDRETIMDFLKRWEAAHDTEDPYHREQYELQGISFVLENSEQIPTLIGGVFVDGVLEAFSIGSYQEANQMAVIHIEKANPEIRGLYAYLNQQFLIRGFPQAKIVNREDDMGLEGLRQAKLSYQPIALARKYLIRQK